MNTKNVKVSSPHDMFWLKYFFEISTLKPQRILLKKYHGKHRSSLSDKEFKTRR